MDCLPAWLAETLAAEFPDQSHVTVMDVVTECAAQYPDVDEMFVEQVARARLAAVPASSAGQDRARAAIPRQRHPA